MRAMISSTSNSASARSRPSPCLDLRMIRRPSRQAPQTELGPTGPDELCTSPVINACTQRAAPPTVGVACLSTGMAQLYSSHSAM
jgi:hypothetical protein